MVQSIHSQNDSSANLRDLPASAKLVFKTLQYEGELTQKQLTQETRLQQRTVRYGVNRLEEHSLITSRTRLADARQSVYEIRSENRDSDPEKA